MAAASEEGNRILKLESEEGKILKLKKEYVAAIQAGLLDEDAPSMVPTVNAAAQPARKKTKKVVVKRLTTLTQAQIDFFKAMVVHPCPGMNLTEDELAMLDQISQDMYRRNMNTRNARFAYIEALIDQQEKFGYAVDEPEAEVTDDEDDDGTVED